jgi:hypothetical protein
MAHWTNFRKPMVIVLRKFGMVLLRIFGGREGARKKVSRTFHSDL